MSRAVTYSDPQHGRIRYYYSKEHPSPECDYCRLGECVQRVEELLDHPDAAQVIVHNRATKDLQ